MDYKQIIGSPSTRVPNVADDTSVPKVNSDVEIPKVNPELEVPRTSTVDWDGTEWHSHADNLHKNISRRTVPATRRVHTSDDIAQQQAELFKVRSGEANLSTSMRKGNYGEIIQDEYYRQFGYERISKDIVTSLDTPSHKGIDGVYYNPDGHPPYIISEAKYNTAQLNKGLADGTNQMDYDWIQKRLKDAVGKERADAIREAMDLGDVQSNLFNVKKDGGIIINQLDDSAKKMK